MFLFLAILIFFDQPKISRNNRSGAAGGGVGGGGGGVGRSSEAAAATSSRQYNGRQQREHQIDDDDDDAETYFAYSNDGDLLGSKTTGVGNGSETSPGAGGYGPSQMSETSIPNFLLKLWKLVEDDRYNQCIEWDAVSEIFYLFNYLFFRNRFRICDLQS